jgi:hypothetical protein
MYKVMVLFSLLLWVSLAVVAQDLPRADLFVGYTHTWTYNSNGDNSSSNGGTAAVAFYPTTHFGLVADFGGSVSGGFTNNKGVFVGADSHSIHYLFGPRFRFGNERITPFVQALFGGVTRSDVVNSATGLVLVPGQTAFGLSTGGGIDLKLAHHWSVRAVQVE